MAREPNIPLFLWVATAMLAHIFWGGGADQVSDVLEARTTLTRFARAVRGHVQGQNAPVEIAIWDESALEEAPTPRSRPSDSEQEAPPEAPPPEEDENLDEETKSPKAEDEKPKTTEQPSPEERIKEKPPEKPAPPPQVAAPVKPVVVDRRVAVKQTPQNPTEENPDAEFIADQANKVLEQTQARITSTDQHEPDPTPGQPHRGPSDDEGNAIVSDLGQSQDSPGDPEKAPSESDLDGVDKAEANLARSRLTPDQRIFEEAAAAAAERTQAPPHAKASKGQQARAALAELEAAPKTADSPTGSFTMNPEQEARAAQTARRAQARRGRSKRKSPQRSPFTGLGTLQTTPGGINPNLNQLTAQSVIGQEQLRKQRVADGERRRSKHRGSFTSIGLERWRASIENYVASVKPGNQTALNTARSPFANYLNHIHNRLHPEFAHGFLSSLDALPSGHAMNRPDIKTHMEIVLGGEDGRVVRLGITRASGSTAFDVGALESVQGASPFGAPPREIVSPDGRVYLHWEFYRNPTYACSTYFARPYILRVAPAPAPSPPSRSTPEEHGKREPGAAPNPQQDG